MSSDFFQAPSFASGPTVQQTGNLLTIRTPFLQYLLLLFATCKIAHFNNSTKRLELRVKSWWRWKRPVRIEYSKISYIDITHPKLQEDQQDKYKETSRLYLITKNPFKRIHLFNFESAATHDSAHSKFAESCANLISQHTRIQNGIKPVELPPAQFNDKYICTTCGHQLHPDSEFILCKYCGGKEIEIV